MRRRGSTGWATTWKYRVISWYVVIGGTNHSFFNEVFCVHCSYSLVFLSDGRFTAESSCFSSFFAEDCTFCYEYQIEIPKRDCFQKYERIHAVSCLNWFSFVFKVSWFSFSETEYSYSSYLLKDLSVFYIFDHGTFWIRNLSDLESMPAESGEMCDWEDRGEERVLVHT